MANTLLPVEERNLTPDQVSAIDKRRRRGFMLLVVSIQFAIIASVLLLWVGQDLTYSPGFANPIAYYFAIVIIISVFSGIAGVVLRRGAPEF
jgi:hypothetical protein